MDFDATGSTPAKSVTAVSRVSKCVPRTSIGDRGTRRPVLKNSILHLTANIAKLDSGSLETPDWPIGLAVRSRYFWARQVEESHAHWLGESRKQRHPGSFAVGLLRAHLSEGLSYLLGKLRSADEKAFDVRIILVVLQRGAVKFGCVKSR